MSAKATTGCEQGHIPERKAPTCDGYHTAAGLGSGFYKDNIDYSIFCGERLGTERRAGEAMALGSTAARGRLSARSEPGAGMPLSLVRGGKSQMFGRKQQVWERRPGD